MTSLDPYYQPDYPKEEEGGVWCIISERKYPAAEMLTDPLSSYTKFGELYFHESKVYEYLDIFGLKGKERYGVIRDLKRYEDRGH